MAGGFARSRLLRTEDATGNLLENSRQTNRFVSAHAALQADVWRQLFVSGSILRIRRTADSNQALFKDQFGRVLISDGLSVPGGPLSNLTGNSYSECGVGWRFNSLFLAQYVISTDYTISTPSHTLLLRYTFHAKEK